MTDYVLGVDIGSGSVKLTLLSREGKIAATAGCEYPTYYPHVGWCEQDPEDWCRAFKTAFGDILKTAGVGAERIKALSFDAATHTAVLLGQQKQVLRRAAVLFPEEGVRTLSCEELELGYRHSLLTDRPEAVVLRVVFQLTAGRPEEIRQKMEELMTRRKASQPLEYPSAGSTFKRPEGYFAAALIDQCGLKGMTVGGAQVSEKHAGFVINRGGATCADVTALMAVIQRRVWEEKGVRLEPEIKMIH